MARTPAGSSPTISQSPGPPCLANAPGGRRARSLLVGECPSGLARRCRQSRSGRREARVHWGMIDPIFRPTTSPGYGTRTHATEERGFQLRPGADLGVGADRSDRSSRSDGEGEPGITSRTRRCGAGTSPSKAHHWCAGRRSRRSPVNVARRRSWLTSIASPNAAAGPSLASPRRARSSRSSTTGCATGTSAASPTSPRRWREGLGSQHGARSGLRWPPHPVARPDT